MTQKEQAKEMYFSGHHTQKDIAQAVGVDNKTIYRWVKQDAWDKLKQATHVMPVVILDNMYCQLVELQNDIADREEGKRYPTPQEADTTRKLVNCIQKMQAYPSLPQNIQMMQQFSSYVNFADHQFAEKLVRYADSYLRSKAIYGYWPYNIEHVADLAADQNGEIAALKQELEQKMTNRQTGAQPLTGYCAPLSSTTLTSPTENIGSQKDCQLEAEDCELQTDCQFEIENCKLKPGISDEKLMETQPRQAIQDEEEIAGSCPPPGKTGHPEKKRR